MASHDLPADDHRLIEIVAEACLTRFVRHAGCCSFFSLQANMPNLFIPCHKTFACMVILANESRSRRVAVTFPHPPADSNEESCIYENMSLLRSV